MGGIKFPYLNQVTKELWEWCIHRNIWVFAEYIASKENVADFDSRISNIDTKWELSHQAFSKILEVFGIPNIDLFVTRSNCKCSKFCSWQKDPECFAVNAFTISWKNFYWYAFPPFSLIPRVLKKVREEKSRGIIVVPFWDTQPWYPLFLELCSYNKITFKPDLNLLLSPCRSQHHPLADQLSLIAAVVSGNHS